MSEFPNLTVDPPTPWRYTYVNDGVDLFSLGGSGPQPVWFRFNDDQCFFWLNTFQSSDGSEYGLCSQSEERIDLFFANEQESYLKAVDTDTIAQFEGDSRINLKKMLGIDEFSTFTMKLTKIYED